MYRAFHLHDINFITGNLYLLIPSTYFTQTLPYFFLANKQLACSIYEAVSEVKLFNYLALFTCHSFFQATNTNY